MTFGDPWTEGQTDLVDVVFEAWTSSGGTWPRFDYVDQVVSRRGLDAVEVLRSFPSIGGGSVMSPRYCDVIFDHNLPRPADESQIKLAVSGISRHPRGYQTAELFPHAES